MGQAASMKLSQFMICSSSTTEVEEEQEEFRPHHPKLVVTAEVPNSKPASLQPNRYSESNRSLQSLAKDSFVGLELVSRPSTAPVVVRPRCGSRRAADPAAVYPGLIAKHLIASVNTSTSSVSFAVTFTITCSRSRPDAKTHVHRTQLDIHRRF